jgi:glycosyltransferase involved in cell wall biosynthesis
MKVLFISRWFPYPLDNGSKIRVFNLIKWLSSCHEVDLISFASEGVGDERLDDMRRYCRHVDLAPYRSFQPGRLKALLGFMSRRPRSVVDTHSVEMQQLVERSVRERSFDVVISSEIDMAVYARQVPSTPMIFEDVELTVLYERVSKESHCLARLRSWLTWWKSSLYVSDLLRVCDGCTVVSERERERILQVSPGYRSIAIVPNGVDVAHYASDFGAPETDTLVYPGALTYSANFDAMDFFLREVFPLIRAERPNVRVSITGRLDGVPVDRLPGGDGVILTGYLDDVRPAVAQS